MSSETDQGGDIVYPSAIPFILVHVACLCAIWSGATLSAFTVCLGLYLLRMFAIGAGYHRYFSHRSFSTSRIFQFILAFVAQSSAQKSVLWWAMKHRHHHLHSDTAEDAHSPGRKGLFYSHVGWIFDRKHDKIDFTKIADFARYPELVLLHRLELAPAFLVAAFCFVIGGWPVLLVGFMWSTVLLYHATFCINSLAHMHGKKRYVTGDDSRNNWLLALFTMGEGWHNNHHAYQSSVRQSFRWWEIDPTYYILTALSWAGMIWDLRVPPKRVLCNEQRLGFRVINRAAEQLAVRFNSERIALSIRSMRSEADLSVLLGMVRDAPGRATEAFKTFERLSFPTREELLAEARAVFAKNPSIDEIVTFAHEKLFASVSTHLLVAQSSRISN